MTAKCFVDTNVFVYARDTKDAVKRKQALELIARLRQENCLVISSQVVTEFCVAMTGKLSAPEDRVFADAERLLQLSPIPLDSMVLHEGLRIRTQYKLSWWDSWIVGAAIVSGCTTLYSEDLAAGASYHGVTVVNPFS